MSTTIDQRVVEMQFDNRQFERNVQTSMSTIDKLKQSLNLTGAAKGFEEINSVSRKINFSGMTNAAENVVAKFSYMQMTIQHQLDRIVDSAVNAGKKIASALTIDPIKSGFQEYETQINAVQTILANTSHAGTTLNDVNAVLDDLNLYADKTIYNFTEMTRNIGTFTAAGLGLKESASAIKGIANLAAVSGSTSAQASTAMYQLSQALANGTVNLQDWNSVVNAGMGGKVFQDALVRTAAAMKGVSEETFRAKNITGSFRESIGSKDGTAWLSAEVLSKTLQQFTGDLSDAELAAMGFTQAQIKNIQEMAVTANDAATKVKTFTQLWDTLKEAAQSGWTQTWELIVGDFEEAKELLTKISDTIGGMLNDSATSRNEMLAGALNTNWEKLIEKINEAGVETVDFEEKLEATAKKHGVDVDKMIKEHGSLEKAFRAGAISSTVLDDAVKSLSGKLVDLTKIERDLKKGLKGTDVKEVQTALKELGYDLGKADIDGKFGSMTESAVKAFQKMNGLKVTGIVDDATLAALDKAANKIVDLSKVTRDLKKGLKGEDVKEVQTALKNLGYDLGKAGVDGDLGKATESAIKAFQEASELKVTGIVDAETLKALDEASNKTKDLSSSCKDLISNITELGGRERLIQSLWNIFDGIMSVVKPIKEAFREIFPPTTAEQLLDIIKSFEKFTEKLILSDVQSEKLKTTFKGLFSIIDIGVTFIKDLVRGAVELIGNFTGLGSGILDITSSLGEWLTNLRDSVKETNLFGETIDNMVNFVSRGIDAIKNFAKAIKRHLVLPELDGFVSIMKSVWSVISYVGSAAIRLLAPVGKAISSLFEGANLFDVLESGLLAGAFVGLQKYAGGFKDLIESLIGDDGLISGIKDNITGILDDIRGCFESYQQNLQAGTLMKIASAIGILAASIFVISTIDSEKVSESLGAIAVLFAELLGSLAIFNKINGKFKGAIKAMGLMTAMSISIILLASAMKIMASMSWEEIGKGLAGVGALMAELSAFMLASKFTGKLKGTALNIVILSTAMIIMAKAVEAFGKMKWEQIGKGLAAIGGILVELALFTTLTGNAKHVTSTGLAMVLLGAAMKIFASAVKDFSYMDWDEIGRGLVAMGGALAEITLALNLMPKNVIGKGIGLIAVGAALHIFASALNSFSSMSWEEIGRGLIAMGGALVILAGALHLMNGTLGGSAALLVATASLAVLTPILKTLGNMSWEEIGKGLLTIAGAFAIIGVAGLLLGPIVPAILGLAGSMAIFSLSILGIGAGLTLIGIGLTSISAGITSLGVSLAAAATSIVAGLTVIIVGILDLIPTILSKLGEGIVVLCQVIAECAPEIAETILVVISEILGALAKYTPQIVDSLMTFVIGLLNAFSEKLPELIQAAVNVISAFFQGIVDALSGIDTTSLLKGIAGVGLLTALMIALSAAASFVPGAMIGVIGMGAVIAEIAILIAALGAIAQIPGLSWLIEEGGDFLEVIGTAIGKFVGGIAGGIAQGITSSLPEMGTDLSKFMENIKPFIEGAKSIDSGAMDGVKSLVGVILGLTAANILEGLTSWFTGGSSLTKFGAELAEFGPCIKKYADSISGIDSEAVSASANAATALAEMTSHIPNEGGMVAWFTGENSIAKFGTELVTLGEGLKSYSTSISGFDAEAVVASANAAKAIADMTSHIPNEGGMVAWFTGNNSIAKFGTDLVMLGMGLKAYSMSIAGFNPVAVTASTNAAVAIADMTSHIPNEGGIKAWFTGESSVASFASKLPLLGSGLKSFSESVEGINIENMTAATNASKVLAEMADTIPNEGGMVAWFTGESSVANFALQLPILGAGLLGFSNSVEGINIENVSSAANAAKALAEMANTIPNEGGIKAWFSGDNSVAKFAGQLPTLGSGLKGFSKSVEGIVPENVTAAANAAKSLAEMAETTPKNSSKIVTFGDNLTKFGDKIKSYFDKTSGVTAEAITSSTKAVDSIKSATTGFNSSNVTSAAKAINTMVDSMTKMSKVKSSSADGFNSALKKLGSTNVQTIVSTFDDAGPKLLNAGSKLIGEFVKGVGKKDADIKKAGQKSLEKFIEGIESKESATETACKNVVSACVNTMNGLTGKFSTVGKNLVKGFASGISANTYLATAKAKAMANAAEKAAREALDINSPSKVFRSIGYSVPEGFAMGIDKMRRVVTASSTDMATSAISNVKSSISRMADIINSDIDSQPTIRPVLDLSNVKAGASSINGLFGTGITIDTSRVNQINSLMNQRNQNGTNDDIISAINKLRKDLSNAGSSTYNLNGLTYNEGSDVAEAFKTIVRAATIERRV